MQDEQRDSNLSGGPLLSQEPVKQAGPSNIMVAVRLRPLWSQEREQ
jgi:hypothetical protein